MTIASNRAFQGIAPLALLGALGTSLYAQPDYPGAVWRPPSGCSKYYTSGNGHHFCVIHDMEGYYYTAISYLDRCDVSASIYYGVNGLTDSSDNGAPPGEITQCVREAYYAWHACCWNTWMFGTEHEGFASNPAWYTEAMYQASGGLQKHLCDNNSIPKDRNHIIAHGEKSNANWVSWMAANYPSITATCNSHTDPGPYWDWNHFMSIIQGQVNNASVVSISAPGSIGCGQQFTATVVMNNNGTKPWTSDGTPHNLGAQDPQDNNTWGFNRVALASSPINAGQNATFTFTATAPASAGTYSFDWKMVEDGVQWFGATATATITVTNVAPVPAGSGDGLQGSYFNGTNLSTLVLTRTDATVNFDWGAGSPDPLVNTDYFSVRWQGLVEPRYTQLYTFYTATDDGVRLWINGQLLIDKWADQGGTEWSANFYLTTGQKYDIKMEYYEHSGGAAAKLSWSSANQAKEIIPQTQWTSYVAPYVGSGAGLQGNYFDNSDFTGTQICRIDSTVNFDWGSGSPDGAIGPDTFSARWTGQVQAQYNEDYTFYTTTDDGVRLWVNGQLLIDKWVNQSPTEWSSAPLTLVAGQSYDIKMEYYENTSGAMAKLYWSSYHTAKKVIPQSQLYVNSVAPGTGSGLQAVYYDNMDFTGASVMRIDPTVNFNWGTNSPDPAIGADTFSARWTGTVQPRYTQPYTFYTLTDDGVRLWVNGQLLIDKWVDQGGVEWSGVIWLTAGQQYSIQMDYYENTGSAQANLSWSAPSVAKAIIPQSQLYPPMTPPSITTQPASQSVAQGSNAAFSVVAAGTAPLSYQWTFNGATVSGATLSNYTVSNAQSTDAGSYAVVVTNAFGTVTSANAILTVNIPPSITTQPASQTVNQGSSATFSVVATGTAPLSYQWKFNGANISGATTSSLAKSNVQGTDAGSYAVVVSNMAGNVTSANAILSVNLLPTITTQPASQSVAKGANATFSVVAAGTAPLSYQWKFNGANIAGATASSLAKSNVQPADAGSYSVGVTNLVGGVVSANAVLTVNSPPTLSLGASRATEQVINFESITDYGNDHVMFRKPLNSSTTSAFIDSAQTNYSMVVSSGIPAGNPNGDGSKALKAGWTFLAGTTNAFLRLDTLNSTYIPNPAFNFNGRVRFDIYADKSIALALGMRETGSSVAVGANGGSSGTIEWVGATGKNGSAPICTRTISAATWTTVEFNLPAEPCTAFTGNGVLEGAQGVLESIAIVPNAGLTTYTIYVDNFQMITTNTLPAETVTMNSNATLTFTGSATDPDAGQTLTYSLDAGAPAGASVNGSTGAFTWTPTSGGTTNTITVRATDNGTPAQSDAKTITVVVNTDPLGAQSTGSSSVATSGEAITLTWTATPGARYQVQYKQGDGEWTDLGAPIVVSGSEGSVEVSSADQEATYRILDLGAASSDQ